MCGDSSSLDPNRYPPHPTRTLLTRVVAGVGLGGWGTTTTRTVLPRFTRTGPTSPLPGTDDTPSTLEERSTLPFPSVYLSPVVWASLLWPRNRDREGDSSTQSDLFYGGKRPGVEGNEGNRHFTKPT